MTDKPQKSSEENVLSEAVLDDVSDPKRGLPPEALRALEEAKARREAQEQSAQDQNNEKPAERGGPKGEEPTRFGDWERGGRAVDF